MPSESDLLSEKLEGYLAKAAPLFESLTVVDDASIDEKTIQHFTDMALGYYRDARHFYEKGEYVNAFGALEYAEGWLDAGKSLGIFR